MHVDWAGIKCMQLAQSTCDTTQVVRNVSVFPWQGLSNTHERGDLIVRVLQETACHRLVGTVFAGAKAACNTRIDVSKRVGRQDAELSTNHHARVDRYTIKWHQERKASRLAD